VVLAVQGQADGVSWDGFQREVLVELGLPVYALAGAQVHVEAHSTQEPPSPLLLALLRAAAAGVERTDALALCQEFLAANPVPCAKARRAFWPQLRRLRAAAT